MFHIDVTSLVNNLPDNNRNWSLVVHVVPRDITSHVTTILTVFGNCAVYSKFSLPLSLPRNCCSSMTRFRWSKVSFHCNIAGSVPINNSEYNDGLLASMVVILLILLSIPVAI